MWHTFYWDGPFNDCRLAFLSLSLSLSNFDFALVLIFKLYSDLSLPQAAHRTTPDLILALHHSNDLFYFYFDSFTYPKIIKFSPRISKLMMIIFDIFNSHFTPIFLDHFFVIWPFFFILILNFSKSELNVYARNVISLYCP
jgi:hypothetical protein